VLGQDAAAARLPDGARPLGGERGDVLGNLLAVAGDQHLGVGLQEQLDPSQASVIRQPPAPAASNTRVAGLKPMAAMLSRATFSTGERAGVEGVVVAGADVADRADVGRHRLVVPAVAADEERPLGRRDGGVQEELLHPGLAVGQAVGEEAQVRGEARLGRHGMVRRGVERVVDRVRHPAPGGRVGRDHRRAAAVGHDHVEQRQGGANRVVAGACISSSVAAASTSQNSCSASGARGG
jgi:hypothetical protein